MLLLIDYREKSFIEKLEKYKENCENKEFELKHKISNLNIGDFLIIDDTYLNNNHNEEISIEYIYQNLILLIERKTFSDLSSSIIDGRFREQKSRIEESVKDNEKIMYIIEGIRKENAKFGLKMNILEGAILNLIFKHKFKVLNTCNIDDTIETILMIYKKYNNTEFINRKNEIGIIPEMKFTNLKKSDRITNNIFNLQLCVIPGVSINIAKKITEKYQCMMDLMNTYNNEEDINKKENMLSDILINDKRKLGKALSKKIYNAFCYKDII